MPDKSRAKELILQIIELADGRLEAENRLHKAFYAAHLIYWKKHNGLLSDYPLVKMPNGPGVDGLRRILAELAAEGRIEIEQGEKGPYQQTIVRLTARIDFDRTTPEAKALRRAVNWVKRHSTRYLSDKTHEKPSYDGQPRLGYEQAIYLDLLPPEEYTEVVKLNNEAREAFKAAFAQDD